MFWKLIICVSKLYVMIMSSSSQRRWDSFPAPKFIFKYYLKCFESLLSVLVRYMWWLWALPLKEDGIPFLHLINAYKLLFQTVSYINIYVNIVRYIFSKSGRVTDKVIWKFCFIFGKYNDSLFVKDLQYAISQKNSYAIIKCRLNL